MPAFQPTSCAGFAILLVLSLIVSIAVPAYAWQASTDHAGDPFLSNPLEATPAVEERPSAPTGITIDVDASPTVEADDQEKAGKGNALVRDAITRLNDYQSIKASLRQQVQMFGHKLSGVGEYRQLNLGNDLLVRLDMKIQLDDRAATFQQIADGRFLWSYCDSPDVRKLGAFEQRLSRIDLDLVRQAVPIPTTPEAANVSTSPTALAGPGGLSGLLSELESLFLFDDPQSGTIYGVQVYMVFGKWREGALEQIFAAAAPPDTDKPGKKKSQKVARPSLTDLPSQMPHHVILALDRADLFPYRIEYRRKIAEKSLDGIVVKSNTREIMWTEFHDVQTDVEVDRREFIRRSDNLPVVDQTATYLREHGLQMQQ